jgi:glycosyltransferase involved in cell wall biosynthesis
MPLVSVIIPAFNAAPYLADALESALRQTHHPTEVVVVDDGSSDGTVEIARGYDARGVRVIEQANAGASAARNNGLRHAAGDYVQYLDADDMISDNKVSEQVALLERYGGEYVASCGWGRFDRTIAEANFVPEAVWADLSPIDWLLSAWTGGGMMQTACWLTPRAVAERAGVWNEDLRANPNDDGEYFCRILLASRGVKFAPGGRVYYRSGIAHSVSRGESRDAVASLFGTCERYEDNIRAAEDSPRTRRASALNYAAFMYRFHPGHPDLQERARRRIQVLGFERPPICGGGRFQTLARLVGFDNALALRAVMSKAGFSGVSTEQSTS